ncbi:TonB-dependent receptor [Phenylobacterium montanum]|uniref:TonB-dependent receptor n=1 Tax=Phenylobacterium montanum TaxID=2823693 RepID=A0A975FVW2_9CAUL|nr:TonB-dependent receptor [Caulobacter sp. S6]QUD85927.1 TonB-dependent receptor [Caulobacter sp. S6]
MKRRLLLQSTILAAGLMAGQAFGQTAPSAQQPPPSADQAGPSSQAIGEVVVTGVFSAKRIEAAPISINVVTTSQLSEQNAVSAADLLKNVPGVFVNSSLGEIRNVVFSRGISANSLDGAGGYYYVSLQEDGLPVDLITASNYGPDYYLRPDITLSRLEGLRGGTAAITGPNAPGGIFNYISKNGRSDPGVELAAKYGLQGDGSLPYYRVDAYVGGKAMDNLYYSIGGFYRTDDGTHDAGYALNKGGQVKANLLWNYSQGSVLLTAKYLDDSNDWNEFTPAFGGKTIAPGFSNTTSDLQPANASHCFPRVGGGRGCWNPSDLVHSKSLAFGATWKHEFSDGFHIENKMRYSHNRSQWNSGAVLSVVSLEDPIVNIIMGTAFAPGAFNYYQGGKLLASITSQGNAFAPGNYTVNSNNLPNQGILTGSNLPGNIGAYVGFGDVQNSYSDQFVDQFTVTKDLGQHHLALGAYVALARLSTNASGSPGIGLMTLTPKPQMMTETYTPAGGSTVYQVTDPTGFGAYGQPAVDGYHGNQELYSVFFGDSWKVNDKLTLEAGGRWESIKYDIFNQSWTSSPFGAVPQLNSSGGADGNPLTLYDNGVSTPGPIYRTKRDYDYFNYSLAVDYDLTSDLATYVRYTEGSKAPDFGGIEAINTPGRIATEFDAPQKIRQAEIGIKYSRSGISLQLFPFYSLLENVNVPAVFNYTSGPLIGQQYVEPAFQGQITTYGVEVAGAARITSSFNVHGNLTLQEPKASKFYNWTQGPKGDGSDDVKTLIKSGDADNNPKIITRAGFDWNALPDVKLFGEVTYLGKRAANAADAFYLPAFTTVDLGAAWNVTKNIKLQFNVNNVFDEVGVMSWSSTGFLASLNRQGLTPAAYNPRALYPIVPSQARSYFLTLSAKY